MIRLSTDADRMHKLTEKRYRNELVAAPQDACVPRRLRSELAYCAPPKAALFDLVCGENEALRFCCEF